MKLRKIIKEQKGAALVEFAIIVPLLLLFLFAIIEFGFLLYNKAMITNAAREGARAGIVFDASGRLDETGIAAVVNTYATNNLINFDSSQMPQFNPRPTHTDSDTTERFVDVAIAGDFIDSGESLKVTVEYDYQFLAFPNIAKLVRGSFSNTTTVVAVTTMRYE